MNYNREVEDGFGCAGLVPTAAERRAEKAEEARRQRERDSAAELSRLRGERQELARLLESALPFVMDASGETPFDEEKLRAFEAKIAAAIEQTKGVNQ